MKKSAYQRDVIDPGDEVSKFARRVNVESYHNCPAIHVLDGSRGSFRGSVGWVWQDHILEQMTRGDADEPLVCELVQNDSAGGKPQFFTLLGEEDAFYELGWEIIVMNADDVVRFGGFPAIMVNEACFKRVTQRNMRLAEAMFRGYGKALERSRLANITGETAIMKHSITAFCDRASEDQLVLTWGATCIGLLHRERFIDGSGIKPGMAIVGFGEKGYRCNGGTAFTNLLLNVYGRDIRALLENEKAREFIRKLCVPSASYANAVTRLVGWLPDGRITDPLARIYGIAHITGGGLWGKLGDLLPSGVGAYLDSMPEPPKVLLEAYELSQSTPEPLSEYECYGTFHGGCGMLVVCHWDDSETVIRAAQAEGVDAEVVGETTKSKVSRIDIESRFAQPHGLLSSKRPRGKSR